MFGARNTRETSATPCFLCSHDIDMKLKSNTIKRKSGALMRRRKLLQHRLKLLLRTLSLAIYCVQSRCNPNNKQQHWTRSGVGAKRTALTCDESGFSCDARNRSHLPCCDTCADAASPRLSRSLPRTAGTMPTAHLVADSPSPAFSPSACAAFERHPAPCPSSRT